MSVRDLLDAAADAGTLRAEELSGEFALAAERAAETVEQTYRIGGQDVRLRFAGRSLLDRL